MGDYRSTDLQSHIHFAGVGLINLTYLPEMDIFGTPVKINIVMALFGLFLVYAGIKSWGGGDDDDDEDYSIQRELS